MKNLLLLVTLLTTIQLIHAQEIRTIVPEGPNDQKEKIANRPFTYVQQMPVAGYDLDAFLSNNIHYPDSARFKNISGRVIMQFVVNEDGSISDINVLRGIGGGCDEEAARVIRLMPPWKPGKQEGKPVRVLFTKPITFTLTD